MRVWVAKRTKAVVVFLAGGIPQGKFNVFPVDLYICNVVLKHGGDVDLVKREIVKLGEWGKKGVQTSGNVPFEKTINKQVWGGEGDEAWSRKVKESANLSASTVAHDDEFPSDLCHCWWLESESLQLSAASL